MRRPLEGISVLAIEHAVAGPFCTRQLADLGARVIKIERPGVGDFARQYDDRVRGMAAHFAWLNRSKESLCLDIKSPQAQPLLHALLSRSDVLVQNLAPGAAQRLGLSFETLHPRYQRLIVCDISGYGDCGPYRDRKAYDILIQSESGLLSVTGTPEEPCRAGIPIADISAAMYAYSGILAALLQRQSSGRGSRIEVSLLESCTEWMGFPLYYVHEGREPPARTGAAHATIYPYGPFRTGDGGRIILGVQNDGEWLAFCRDVLEQPQLARDARFATNSARAVNRAELEQIIVRVFSAWSAAAIIRRLDGAGIANARMNEVDSVWNHPQLAARNRLTEVQSPVGPLRALKPPGIPQGIEPRMDPVPALGEHTRSILMELGLSEECVAELERRKVI